MCHFNRCRLVTGKVRNILPEVFNLFKNFVLNNHRKKSDASAFLSSVYYSLYLQIRCFIERSFNQRVTSSIFKASFNIISFEREMLEGPLLFQKTIDLAHSYYPNFFIQFLRMPFRGFGSVNKSEMKCKISFVPCIVAAANLIGCSPPIP